MEQSSKDQRRASRPSREERRASRPSKEERRAAGGEAKGRRRISRGLEDFVAKRISDMSTADWKAMPPERRAEFQKAAKRAIAGAARFEELAAKRQEKASTSGARREERREANLKAKKAKSGKADDAS